MVTFTNDEIQNMRDRIASGNLPPTAIADYLKAEEKQVFGVDVQHDKHGRPIEKGIGSASQPSRNSIDAYIATQLNRKAGPEPGYESHLAKMEADFAAYQAKQRAAKAARV
jgi:hypothetical protein